MMTRTGNTAICTTTIFPVREFLQAYLRNIRDHGHGERVQVYIAGDNKSPAGCAEAAQEATSQGLRAKFLTMAAQKDYLQRYPDVGAMVPENSDNRRNVAYLMALEEGADIILSVDDDNFPLDAADFVGEHLAVGREATLPQAVGHAGWYNLCDLLAPKIENLYPRGFPYWARDPRTTALAGPATGRVGLNVGLWKGDPDSDAVGRLFAHPRIDDWDGRNVLLGRGVRCPINTQNTALRREAMAAYYYVRMGAPLRGMKLDRFGDIFSGYFVQVCADAVGDRIRIGSPLADHRRNQHNLLIDLYQELAGIMILEDLSSFLSSVELPGDSYGSAYRALADKLEGFAAAQEGFIWTPETRAYFQMIARNMRTWADVVASLS